ncbi:universal stress protein [Pedobacter sp. B4-66]|uniref:universal stress protein n=1 Tax=Pedobacter sp. B4-66 TaxID=2817280 RepID=UPI001BD99AF4|nr:universal stress protein [Pedobacter sp. B4-66]
MEKILVATDLSANSVSAVRFAYKLSQLTGTKLVIVHIYHLLRPTSWRNHRFENHRNIRKQFIAQKLTKFLDRIFKDYDDEFTNFELDLKMSPNVITSILSSASNHKVNYICISTLGSGKSKKIIGATSSKLIVKSPIPVISIPSTYNIKPLTQICYATDMSNYQKEIRKVIDFATPVEAEIKMLHIALQQETLPKVSAVETKLLKRTGIKVKVKYVQRNPVNTLSEDVNHAVKKIKSTLVVFFIHRSKPYWNSMLHPSKIQPLSIYTKIPILSFKK